MIMISLYCAKMKINKLIYEITLRAGDYQSIKIGGEWSIDHDATADELVQLDTELRESVAQVLEARKAQSKPEPKVEPEPTETKSESTDTRELVKIDTDKFKAILKKIQDGASEEVVRKYFRFDESAEKILKVAFQPIMHK